MSHRWSCDQGSTQVFAHIPSKIIHAIKLQNPFNATHKSSFPLSITGVTNYFDLKRPTPEEYKVQYIPKLELMVGGPPMSSSEFSQIEQSMFYHKE